jgi:hypothetical protein
MKPVDIAESLGSDVDAVTAALDELRRAGRAHPTSFGNWDCGTEPLTDASDIDRG